jgi:hypothetical protein
VTRAVLDRFEAEVTVSSLLLDPKPFRLCAALAVVHAQNLRNHMKHLAAIAAEAAAIKALVNIGSEPTPVAPVPM